MAVNDITELGVETTYTDVIQDIYKYFGSDAYLEAQGFSGNYTPDRLIYWANRAGYNVETAKNGNILGYYKKESIPVSNALNNTLEATNSNVQAGTAAASNTVQFSKALETTVDSTTGNVVAGGGLKRFVNGVSETLNKPVGQVGHVVVPGHILPAIAAASTGIQLGKGIDSAIYNIGNALGLNPPESLNPDTWGSITQDLSDTGAEGVAKTVFNALFDIDSDNNTQMYIDQNAFAYMAQYWNNVILAQSQVVENPDFSGTTVGAFSTPFTVSELLGFSNTPEGAAAQLGFTITEEESKWVQVFDATNYVIFRAYDNRFPNNTSYNLIGCKNIPDSFTTSYKYNDGNIAFSPALTLTHSFVNLSASSNVGSNLSSIDRVNGNLNIVMQSGYGDSLLIGKVILGQPAGVSDLSNATVPDLSTATDPATMLELLKTLYPDLWDNRIENNVVQPDGSTITYTYIPVPMPTGGTGEAVDTQNATQPTTATSPTTSTSPAEQIATLLKIITQAFPQGMTDPKTITDPQPGTNPLNPTTGHNPPDTGTGDTPTVILPTGSASSLYAIYNPTLEQVNSLGAWLWSSDFIDQILKLFSDPMQAIIGLHKIYATPATGGSQNIKVGYLDSGVSSLVVSNQYTTVDCGSVSLAEYFGNVFDYSPYTAIRLYLPFIGIVDLDNDDVMRSTIHVVYHVDVLSGACLAEVRVTRDGVGGTLYQYAGNCAVTMPISSGSYIGVIANVVGVASSVVGGFASGGALGAVAGGVTGALTRRGGTQVQHSGNFSGNAGAMGIKKPYIIIERPQTQLAANYSIYIGNPSNETVTLSSCSGYIQVKEVHLENIPATQQELTQIETLLKGGVIV